MKKIPTERRKWGTVLFISVCLLLLVGFVDFRFFFYALFLLITWFLVDRYQIPTEIWLRKKPNLKDWGFTLKLGIPALIGSLCFVFLNFYLLSFIFPDLVVAATHAEGFDTLAGITVAVILAPLIEEVVFRGVLFPLFANRWSYSTGIIGSSLIFGFLHFDFLGATLFSVLMCVLLMKTATLWIPIFVHFLNNTVATGAMFFAEERPPVEIEEVRSELLSAALILSIGVPFLIYVLKKNWPTRRPDLQTRFQLGDSSS
jgi:uncharacterized protein